MSKSSPEDSGYFEDDEDLGDEGFQSPMPEGGPLMFYVYPYASGGYSSPYQHLGMAIARYAMMLDMAETHPEQAREQLGVIVDTLDHEIAEHFRVLMKESPKPDDVRIMVKYAKRVIHIFDAVVAEESGFFDDIFDDLEDEEC